MIESKHIQRSMKYAVVILLLLAILLYVRIDSQVRQQQNIRVEMSRQVREMNSCIDSSISKYFAVHAKLPSTIGDIHEFVNKSCDGVVASHILSGTGPGGERLMIGVDEAGNRIIRSSDTRPYSQLTGSARAGIYVRF